MLTDERDGVTTEFALEGCGTCHDNFPFDTWACCCKRRCLRYKVYRKSLLSPAFFILSRKFYKINKISLIRLVDNQESSSSQSVVSKDLLANRV